MEGTALCPCQLVYLYQVAPAAPVLLATLDNFAKLPRTPRVTQTTPVPTKGTASCFPLINTSVCAPADGQVLNASMWTAVSPALVPTVEDAALCWVVATPAPVLLAIKVLAALMTQMNV